MHMWAALVTGVSVSLIAAAIYDYATGNHVRALIMGGAGLVGFVVAYYFSKKKPEPTLLIKDSGNATATAAGGAGGNATSTGGSVTQHFYGTPTATAPAAAPAPPKEHPLPAPKEKKIELVAREITQNKIKADLSAEVWRLSSDRDSFVSLLLPFYFDPVLSDTVYAIEHVRAHLVFTENNVKRTFVDHGCWIGYSLDFCKMRPGETKYLLLVLAGVADGFAAVNTRRTTDASYGKDAPFELIPLALKVCDLQVVLIWGGGGQFKKVFEFKNIDLALLSKYA